MEFVRDGDVLYVADFSRLARNVRDLLSIAELLKENKVRLVSLKRTLIRIQRMGSSMFTLIGAIAEFERENLWSVREKALRLQRARVYQGRKKKEAADFEKYYALYQKKEITKKKMG